MHPLLPQKTPFDEMNWIHVNTTLPTSPKIVILAELLKCKRREAFGLVIEFFCWVDANFSDGHTHLTPKQINKLFDQKRFAESMCEIGWGGLDEKGHYIVQDFDSYNGKNAKRRIEETERKRKQRANGPTKRGTESAQPCPQTVPENVGLDKIREEYIDNISSNESILSDPQKQTKSPHAETADSVLTYLASLPNCGLVGQELTTCAQTFFDRSEAVGWTINGQPIRDWRAAARAYLAKWQGNNASQQAANRSNQPKITYRSQSQQSYDLR